MRGKLPRQDPHGNPKRAAVKGERRCDSCGAFEPGGWYYFKERIAAHCRVCNYNGGKCQRNDYAGGCQSYRAIKPTQAQ